MPTLEEKYDSVSVRVSELEIKTQLWAERQNRQEADNDDIKKDLAAWRMESKIRDEAQSNDIRNMTFDIRTLTTELSKSRGIQEEKIRKDEQSIRAWKKAAVIIGIVLSFVSMVGGIVVATPNFSSTFFFKFLPIPDSAIHATLTTGPTAGQGGK